MQPENLHSSLEALAVSAEANQNTYISAQSMEDPAKLLEFFPAPVRATAEGFELSLNITTNEFTSLCPLTHQPDFATIVINYVPGERCVESKSLKLYLLSYRNRGHFHEAVVSQIAHDLVELLQPKRLEVIGQFTPRGGIPFWPTVKYQKP